MARKTKVERQLSKLKKDVAIIDKYGTTDVDYATKVYQKLEKLETSKGIRDSDIAVIDSLQDKIPDKQIIKSLNRIKQGNTRIEKLRDKQRSESNKRALAFIDKSIRKQEERNKEQAEIVEKHNKEYYESHKNLFEPESEPEETGVRVPTPVLNISDDELRKTSTPTKRYDLKKVVLDRDVYGEDVESNEEINRLFSNSSDNFVIEPNYIRAHSPLKPYYKNQYLYVLQLPDTRPSKEDAFLYFKIGSNYPLTKRELIKDVVRQITLAKYNSFIDTSKLRVNLTLNKGIYRYINEDDYQKTQGELVSV